jgi:ABC-2 type transport system permease protein
MDKILNIAHKEVYHILRDARSLIIAILMPIMMTFLYGYAINLDIKNIELGVLDQDQSYESRDLIGRFYNSGYFMRPSHTADLSDPELSLKRGDAHAILIIKPGFAKAVKNMTAYELGLLVDGADANMASAAGSYAQVIVGRYSSETMTKGIKLPSVTIASRVLYNPDLKSSHFFVPGLIAIILMMISALLTSVTIAREKETGTLEQLLTAPVTPYQIIIGKVAPYILLAMLDGILILLFAVFHFGVPFTGSIALLFGCGVIYIIASLSLGILISTMVKTQQLAMMVALVLTLLPSVMLSGFIFEIKNFPLVLKFIAYLIPARYFLLIIRGIMLKGSGIEVLWPYAGVLALITVVLLTLAAKKFHMKIG